MTREDLSSKGWGNSGRLPSIGTTHRPTCGTALSPSSNASSLALERVDRALVPEPTSQRHHGAVLRHMSPATCRDRHGDTCQFFFWSVNGPCAAQGLVTRASALAMRRATRLFLSPHHAAINAAAVPSARGGFTGRMRACAGQCMWAARAFQRSAAW